MISAVTQGIKVSVTPTYQDEHSRPSENKYVFSYAIVIENFSSTTVQLLRRHWIIKDSLLIIREVSGEGVVGQQPILKPLDIYEYSSWCPISSEIGQMSGKFIMEDLEKGNSFEVEVPSFILCATPRSN